MKHLLTILFMTLYTVTVGAQDINTQVLQQISAIRSGNPAQFRALEQAISRRPNDVFNTLAPYRTDTLYRVREWIYEQYHNILLTHNRPPAMRMEIVLQLIGGLSDPRLSIRNDCVDYLTQCNLQDFTPQAQEQFSSLFNSRVWFSRDLVLLAGFIGDASCRATLEEMAYSPPPEQRRLQWHANLALSRMGDNNAMNWCLSQINSIGINDNVVYELLPGLIYTRQQRVYEYLVAVINSDEQLCTSSNPDSGASILCGYRVMEYLAPVVKGYPLKLLPSGDIDTRDYHRALLTVRNWFANKRGEYDILTDTF